MDVHISHFPGERVGTERAGRRRFRVEGYEDVLPLVQRESGSDFPVHVVNRSGEARYRENVGTVD